MGRHYPFVSLSLVFPRFFLLGRCVVSVVVVRARHWVTHFNIALNSSSCIMMFLWLAWLLGISIGPILTLVLPCKVFFIPNNYLEDVKIVLM
jgi:hypothetical protein